MRSQKKKIRFCFYLLLSVTFLLLPQMLFSGGFYKLDDENKPFRWPNGVPIEYNLENNFALKPEAGLGKQETLELFKKALQVWNHPELNITFEQGPNLNDGGDVDGSNFQNFLYGTPDGKSAVIVDSDGLITQSVFGQCTHARSNILAFAGPFGGANGEYQGFTMVLNPTCIPPVTPSPDCGGCASEFPVDKVLTTIVHEMGHVLGLAHSQVLSSEEYQQIKSNQGPSGLASATPSMYPAAISEEMSSLNKDDIVHAGMLYGDISQKTCSVSGLTYQSDGKTPLPYVEVIAINSDDSKKYSDRISHITGTMAKKDADGNCIGDQCHAFTISGLTPGQKYELCIQGLNTKFSGASNFVSAKTTTPSFERFCTGTMVSCDCAEGSSCPNISSQKLVLGKVSSTSASSSEPAPSDSPSGGSGGGCRLQPEK